MFLFFAQWSHSVPFPISAGTMWLHTSRYHQQQLDRSITACPSAQWIRSIFIHILYQDLQILPTCFAESSGIVRGGPPFLPLMPCMERIRVHWTVGVWAFLARKHQSFLKRLCRFSLCGSEAASSSARCEAYMRGGRAMHTFSRVPHPPTLIIGPPSENLVGRPGG